MYNSAIVRRRPLQAGTHPDVGMELNACALHYQVVNED